MSACFTFCLLGSNLPMFRTSVSLGAFVCPEQSPQPGAPSLPPYVCKVNPFPGQESSQLAWGGGVEALTGGGSICISRKRLRADEEELEDTAGWGRRGEKTKAPRESGDSASVWISGKEGFGRGGVRLRGKGPSARALTGMTRPTTARSRTLKPFYTDIATFHPHPGTRNHCVSRGLTPKNQVKSQRLP